jgi:polyhydroxyalkanoate synthesis repressor PhaR
LRKYRNRRYYDSTRSRHLTLEEIYAAIRDGYEIEVIDSKTNQDITGKVLAQMIIELDPPKLQVFPVALLHRLLRANEQVITDFTQKYFSQALDAFLTSQRTFERSLRTAMQLNPQPPDWARMMLGPFAQTPWVGGAQSQGGDLHEVVNQLRQQVEDLQKKRTKTTRKKAKPRSTRKRK